MLLETNYLGLKLSSPLVVASSGLTDNIENIFKLHELGAGAVVLKSLFEEQIISNINDMHYHKNQNFHNSLEFTEKIDNDIILDSYINLINESKKIKNLPIIASINCVSSEVWYYFASKLEDAGCDALELNINLPLLADYTSFDKLMNDYFHIIENVVNNVGIPVSIKLLPYFSNYRLLINTFRDIGVRGIVLFNRSYAPDIDLNDLKVLTSNKLSSSEEIFNTLRWTALLSGKSELEISAATGIHNYEDILKVLLFGANNAQICSTLYKNGIEYIAKINIELTAWLVDKGYSSINEIRGLLSKEVDYSEDYERIQYMVRDNYK